jgi:hypothetical protein
MMGDRDPILDNYDREAEAHINGIINGDIPYMPPEYEEEDVYSYLNLDGEGEVEGDDQGMDIETFAGGRGICIYIEPLVMQI